MVVAPAVRGPDSDTQGSCSLSVHAFVVFSTIDTWTGTMREPLCHQTNKPSLSLSSRGELHWNWRLHARTATLDLDRELEHQLFVGVMLQTQPMFITGLDDTDDAKKNAFGAMGMFLATFGLSIFGIMRTKDDREELESTVDMGYQLSGNVGEFPSSRYD